MGSPFGSSRRRDPMIRPTRPDVMFDSRVGLVLGSAATIAVQFESGWAASRLPWFLQAGCATDSEIDRPHDPRT